MPKKAKKLDPKQVFIVRSYTREEIAESLNEVLDGTGIKVKHFTADDARLTDEFCEAFVSGMDDAICENVNVFDLGYEIQCDILRDMK